MTVDSTILEVLVGLVGLPGGALVLLLVDIVDRFGVATRARIGCPRA